MTGPTICSHGSLRRQCETCDLADEVERLERELAAATKGFTAAKRLLKLRDERDLRDVDRLRSLSGAIAETESERAANARLTEELAAAQQRIAELEQLNRMVGYAAEAHSNDADKWSAQLAAMRSERDAARRDAEALQRFKTFVHDRLDHYGVPKDPPGEHRDAGCRIGQRLEWVFDRYQDGDDWIKRALQAEDEAEALRKDAERLLFAMRDVDGFGGIDINEQACVYASVFGREEPNDDDLLAAIRDAIDSSQGAK